MKLNISDLTGRVFYVAEGRRYVVLTFSELIEFRANAPHLLTLVHGQWCVEVKE